MDHFTGVIPVDIVQSCAEITGLLRRSFAGVAEEMGLTRENCPYHVAFMTEERLLAQLGREDARSFGIRVDSEWVGFVAVAPYQGDYEITRLAVAPEHRHIGYGKALIDRACEVARELGLREISLGMIDENKVLKKWYEAQGFIPGEPFRPEGALYTVCGMSKKL
jgi:ribosomal protein S18 acetylase RimI-like enzyme